mmetsp:Transcript_94232/g.181737  ORF Transcript_94232/g.181737 Transcript_94232/m.181737 type:complete len:228 (+) Transcript_94232:1501-2184(+)
MQDADCAATPLVTFNAGLDSQVITPAALSSLRIQTGRQQWWCQSCGQGTAAGQRRCVGRRWRRPWRRKSAIHKQRGCLKRLHCCGCKQSSFAETIDAHNVSRLWHAGFVDLDRKVHTHSESRGFEPGARTHEAAEKLAHLRLVNEDIAAIMGACFGTFEEAVALFRVVALHSATVLPRRNPWRRKTCRQQRLLHRALPAAGASEFSPPTGRLSQLSRAHGGASPRTA